MKPLNLDNSPCSPTSSNCIIWQGPDIPCIKLCAGDSISDVVFKLATELCTIMDELKVSNYDLSCFNSTACPPVDFQGLIQFLINQICAGGNGEVLQSTPTSGCPDCVVTVAACFIEGTNTTMQLVDYVNLIAQRVCSIINEIQLINDSIANLINITNSLQFQIDNIPQYQLPNITLACAIGPYSIGSQVSLDTLVDVFLNTVWCPFVAATGTSSELLSAVSQKCVLDTTLQLANGQPFSANANWIADVNYNTVADAINNLWVVLCDLRTYVSVAAFNVTDTNTVNLTYSAGVLTAAVQDTGWVNLLGFAFMSANPGRPQCRRIGNVIHFRGYAIVPMGNASSGAGGVINTSNDADDYVPLQYGNTFNTITSLNAADSCLLVGYNSSVWASGTAIGLKFNKGNSVIPTSVIPVGNTLDGSYVLGTRQIIQRSVRTTGNKNAGLNSLVGVTIGSTGLLQISSILYDEDYVGIVPPGPIPPGVLTGYEYSAIGRNVISNIISGENIPTFTPTAPSSYNAAAAATYSPDITGIADTWAFSQNAGHANQLGGFAIQLSGLMSYISPCATLIPTPTPC
jgi:hypothetical protein